MARRSAGLLLYRGAGDAVEVLIVHPGGPFWARKDDGAWSIPKGEYEPTRTRAGGEPRVRRGTGPARTRRRRIDLGEVRQSGGKVVTAFAVGSDFDVTETCCNTAELEWPRGSGRIQVFPEVDRVEWMPLGVARVKLLAAQTAFLDRLREHLP